MRSLTPWPIFPFNLNPDLTSSLSLQFLLDTTIQGSSLIKEFEISNPGEEGRGKEELENILKKTEAIYSAQFEFFFTRKERLLDRLCFYSQIMLQAFNRKSPQINLALEEMEEAIDSFKSIWVESEGKRAPGSLSKIGEEITKLQRTLSNSLVHFFEALFPFLKERSSDENLLVYLIENREKLNRFLGARTVEKLLQSFFPEGAAQLRGIISSRYTERGFDSFLSSVKPHLDAIEWETECQSLTIC